MKKDLLTENEVIDAVISYFNTKGRTEVKKVVSRADASQKEHGVDLQIKLANAKGNGNKYFIEAKGNKRADGTAMRSTFNTNFRWAISQIILRIKVDSTKNNYIYGIAIPDSEIERAKNLIHDKMDQGTFPSASTAQIENRRFLLFFLKCQDHDA